VNFPSTASSNGAGIQGLPFTPGGTTNYGAGGFVTYTNSSLTINLYTDNTGHINFYLTAGGGVANSSLSNKQVQFTCIYYATF
jgi:hypothetical protein